MAFIRQMQSLGFYAERIEALRGLARSDLPRSEKEQALSRIWDRHMDYLIQKAEHFRVLHERCVEARDRKRIGVVGE